MNRQAETAGLAHVLWSMSKRRVVPFLRWGTPLERRLRARFGLERVSAACQTLGGASSGQVGTPAWTQAAAVSSETTVVWVLVKALGLGEHLGECGWSRKT